MAEEKVITLQVGVKALLKNPEGKYLLVERSEVKYGKTSGSWDIVGGRINPGSGLVDNLRREVREETQLEITSEPVLIAAQDIVPNEMRHIVGLTYMADTIGEPVLNEENVNYKWLSLEEIKVQENLDKYVKEVLNKTLS